MLIVEGLEAFYDESQVLFGLDLKVEAGEVVTLLGRNGMGKTTTVNSIFGLVKKRKGKIFVNGKDLIAAPSYAACAAGLGFVPEGRQIFPTLTVQENLVVAAQAKRQGAKWSLECVYAMFPRLKDRKRNMGNQLSGGEQQMLAIGRALMTNPSLVVLDEATEGLAPLIREEIWSCLRQLKEEGQSILVIDKNIDALSRFADRHVVIEKGKVVWQGSNDALCSQPEIKDRFLNI